MACVQKVTHHQLAPAVAAPKRGVRLAARASSAAPVNRRAAVGLAVCIPAFFDQAAHALEKADARVKQEFQGTTAKKEPVQETQSRLEGTAAEVKSKGEPRNPFAGDLFKVINEKLNK